MSTRGEPGRRVRRPVTLEFLASVLVALLAIQFLLRTYLELFVGLPAEPGVGGSSLDGLVVLVLHIAVGTLLVGLTLRMTLVAARSRNRRGALLAGLAALGILVAFLGGMGFTFGAHEDVASFVMAFGFAVAMFCAGILLAGVHVPRPPEEPTTA